MELGGAGAGAKGTAVAGDAAVSGGQTPAAVASVVCGGEGAAATGAGAAPEAAQGRAEFGLHLGHLGLVQSMGPPCSADTCFQKHSTGRPFSLRWLAKSRTQSRTESKPIEEATANLASCADWSLSLQALAGFFFLDCAEEPEVSLALAAARRS